MSGEINPNFEIKQGTQVYDVLNNGTKEQKAAAKIFDFNGDGEYSSVEADFFQKAKVSINGKNVHAVVDGQDWGGNVDEIDKNYEKMSARYQKNAQLLRRFGLDYKTILEDQHWSGGMDVRTGVDKNTGEQLLIIENEETKLIIPINKDYDPSKISIDSGLGVLNNFNGGVVLKKSYDDKIEGQSLHIMGDSEVFVDAANDVSDKIIVYNNAKVTVKSDDYSDKVQHYETKEEHQLKPGKTTITNKDGVVRYNESKGKIKDK